MTICVSSFQNCVQSSHWSINGQWVFSVFKFCSFYILDITPAPSEVWLVKTFSLLWTVCSADGSLCRAGSSYRITPFVSSVVILCALGVLFSPCLCLWPSVLWQFPVLIYLPPHPPVVCAQILGVFTFYSALILGYR